jgi:hypothetical protein
MNCNKNHFDLPCVRKAGAPLSHKRKTTRQTQFGRWTIFWALAAWFVGGASAPAAERGAIHLDTERKLVTLVDGRGQLALRLNYDGRCVLDQVIVGGREVAAEPGVASGIRMDGKWFDTKAGIASPRVMVGKDTLTVTGIIFGKPGSKIHETWQFAVQADRIVWRITRKYYAPATLEDAAFPE